MADAVIVSTSRTPIGRANKGSLVDARPDDMSAHTLSDVLSKVDMDPNEVEDVIWGIGQPGGEGGYNIARVISAQQGLDLPSVTVNRYCSSSLQTIRMAAHAIMAGEGDCFVAGGVETVSRYMHGAADTGPHNEIFADAETRTKERSAGGTDGWQPPPPGGCGHIGTILLPRLVHPRISGSRFRSWARPRRGGAARRMKVSQGGRRISWPGRWEAVCRDSCIWRRWEWASRRKADLEV